MLNEGGYGKIFTSSWKKVYFFPHTYTILTGNNMFDLGERNLRRWQNIKNTIQACIQVSYYKRSSNERKIVSSFMLRHFDGEIGQYFIGKNCAKVNLPKSITSWTTLYTIVSINMETYIGITLVRILYRQKPSNCHQLFVDKHAFINTRFEDTDDIFFDKWQKSWWCKKNCRFNPC